jgi:hypothetical protein
VTEKADPIGLHPHIPGRMRLGGKVVPWEQGSPPASQGGLVVREDKNMLVAWVAYSTTMTGGGLLGFCDGEMRYAQGKES